MKRDVNSNLNYKNADRNFAVKMVVEKGKQKRVVASSEEEDISSSSEFSERIRFPVYEYSKMGHCFLDNGHINSGRFKEPNNDTSQSLVGTGEVGGPNMGEIGMSYNIPMVDESDMGYSSNGLTNSASDSLDLLNVPPTQFQQDGTTIKLVEGQCRVPSSNRCEPIQLEVDLG
ncbi:hypothetical protein Q3G72_007199 [Acer saccharum]|nr:hypothetical protein Q3G72_007199 [Acer saccharum]